MSRIGILNKGKEDKMETFVQKGSTKIVKDGIVVDYPFDFPTLVPVPINTKGLNWFGKLKTWFTSRRQWILAKDWSYKTSEGTIIYIPKGFIFDAASIPRIFWWFLEPTGLLLIPSIIHDFIYTNGFYFILYKSELGNEEPLKVNCTRPVADRMFYNISYEVNEIHLADIPAYWAVRAGGWMAWNKGKKDRKD